MSLRLSVPPLNERVGARPDPDPHHIRAWLAALAGKQSSQRAEEIRDLLSGLNRTRMRVALRQEIAELVIADAWPLIEELSTTLDAATVPLEHDARGIAALLDELLCELAYAYKSLLMEQSRRLFGLASSGRAQLPVVRAMQLLAKRLLLSYRMYATPPKGVWNELHELYHFALRRGFAQRNAGDATQTPLELYRNALLLAFADPLKLMQGDLDRVCAWLSQYGGHATLNAVNGARTGRGMFLIKPQRDVPGYPLSRRQHPTAQPQDLVLNAQPLAQLLAEQLAGLDAGERSARTGLAASITTAETRDLLTRLAKNWGGTPSRRHERLRTHARVDVHVGIAAIWRYLNGAQQDDAPPSEWIVSNESASGFALLHEKGPIEPIRVGEVIGVRLHQDDNCHVCVVRWVLSDHPEHVELGVEEMAPSARAVSLRKVRDPLEVNPEPVLLLPEGASANQSPVIVAPLVQLDSTCELSLGDLQSKIRVRPRQLLERTVSMQLLEFSAA